MVTAGLWLGNRLKVTTPGGAGGTGCSEATAELLTGPGREVAATDFQQGHQMKGEQWARPRLPCFHGPPEGRESRGGIPHRILSTSRSLKGSLGPQVCLLLPPVLPRLAHCWDVFGDHPALFCEPAAPVPSDE